MEVTCNSCKYFSRGSCYSEPPTVIVVEFADSLTGVCSEVQSHRPEVYEDDFACSSYVGSFNKIDN